MELGLRDKVVLVVGASAGIGAATARLLHEEGARLVLVGRRENALSELTASLAGGESVLAIPADASAPGAIPEMLKHGRGAAVLTAAYSIRAHKPELIAYTTLKGPALVLVHGSGATATAASAGQNHS